MTFPQQSGQGVARVVITELVKPQPPIEIGKNLLRIFRGSLHKRYEERLIEAIKNNQWICLNFEDFNWEPAILSLKKISELANLKGLKILKQVVMADVNQLNPSQIITAQTEFGLAGGHFYPFRNKTFEQAVTDFDKDVQEEIDDFEIVQKDARREAA